MNNRSALDKDTKKLENRRVKAGAYSEMIVREQEAVIDAANAGISKVNDDLKALRTRLEPYTTKSPRAWDEKADDLKYTYERRLQERKSFEHARLIANESIAAAKLHSFPGEFEREPKAPLEDGYIKVPGEK